jgi:hypothetical protein
MQYTGGIQIVIEGFSGSRTTWVDSVGNLIGLLGVVLLVVHLWLVRKFLVFAYHEKGILFSIKSFFVGLVLYGFIVAGAAWGKFHDE